MFEASDHLPHDPWTTRCRIMFAISRHRFEQAAGIIESALALDPYSPWLHGRLAWTHHLAGDAEASLRQVHHMLELFPEQNATVLYGAPILAANDEALLAVELTRNLTRKAPHFDLASAVHAYTLARAGECDEAHLILERLQWLSRERFVMASHIPAAWIAIGDLEAARASLLSAEAARCPWLFQMLADSRMEPLAATDDLRRLRAQLAGMESGMDLF